MSAWQAANAGLFASDSLPRALPALRTVQAIVMPVSPPTTVFTPITIRAEPAPGAKRPSMSPSLSSSPKLIKSSGSSDPLYAAMAVQGELKGICYRCKGWVPGCNGPASMCKLESNVFPSGMYAKHAALCRAEHTQATRYASGA